MKVVAEGHVLSDTCHTASFETVLERVASTAPNSVSIRSILEGADGEHGQEH